jgi:hypothetical protein
MHERSGPNLTKLVERTEPFEQAGEPSEPISAALFRIFLGLGHSSIPTAPNMALPIGFETESILRACLDTELAGMTLSRSDNERLLVSVCPGLELAEERQRRSI